MKPIVIIPARLESLRLPRKILIDIHGVPMIEHVRRRVLLSKNIKDVYIATCDKEIKECVEKYGGRVIMTKRDHLNGTSRVAEAVKGIKCDKVILVQGDEPLLLPSQLDKLSSQIQNDNNSLAWNATAPLESEQELHKHSFVKCSVINSQILYCFRKSPSHNNFETQKKYIRKILGLLAFKKDFLITITKNKAGIIEQLESIEQLRIIENSFPLTSISFEKTQASINEPEDIEIALNVLKNDDEQKGLLNKVLTF